jgi:hypothetical protein
MRGSSRLRLLIPMLVAAACAAPLPAFASAPDRLSAPTAVVARATAESVHVFLVTQLAVTDAESLDSALVIQRLDRAALIVVSALSANGVRLARIAGFVRRVDPPNRGDSASVRPTSAFTRTRLAFTPVTSLTPPARSLALRPIVRR